MENVEQLLLRLQGKRVYKEEEDRLIWIESKSGKLFVKALYTKLEPRSSISFGIHGCCPKMGFLAHEALWAKGINFRSTSKEKVAFGKYIYIFVITRKNSFITSLFTVSRQDFYGSCCFYLCAMGTFLIN